MLENSNSRLTIWMKKVRKIQLIGLCCFLFSIAVMFIFERGSLVTDVFKYIAVSSAVFNATLSFVTVVLLKEQKIVENSNK